MSEKEILFELQGDKKVKVEENFSLKIKSFWKNLFKIKDNKLKAYIDKLGLRFTSIFSKKSLKELEKEAEAKRLVDKIKEEHSSLIERIKNAKTEDEINYIVNKFDATKQNALNEMNELLKSDEIKDKDEIRIPLENAIKEAEKELENAKNKAMDKVVKENKKETSSVKTIRSVFKSPGTPKTQVMPTVDDDAPTAIPEIDPSQDEKIDEPEPSTVSAIPVTFSEQDLPEEEGTSETDIEEEQEAAEIEETTNEIETTVESEEKNTTRIINGTNAIDLMGCTDWYDYVEKFFAQSGIGMENVHDFYKDIDKGLYPIGFLNKKEFAVEKQKLEDEIEYKKLEAERSKTEKRLREIEEKQAEVREENTELKAIMSNISTKNAAQRKEIIALKQAIVDKDSQIENQKSEIAQLKGQLAASEEVAKKAQAKSYEDRKLYEEVEKKNAALAEEIKEMKKIAAENEKMAGEATRKAEKLQREINKKISAAVEQIKGLSRPDDDDIDKAIIRDLEEKFNKEINIEKKEEKKPKHKATKDETKEEKKETTVVEEPKHEEIKEPAPEPEIEITAEEPQTIGFSKTPDSEYQGVVTQEPDGHISIDFTPDDDIKSKKEELEATRADLVSAIEKEAEEYSDSEGTKTR